MTDATQILDGPLLLPRLKAFWARPLALWLSSMRRTFRDHVPLYACVILFCGATIATSLALDQPVPYGGIWRLLGMVPLIVGFGFVFGAIRHFGHLLFVVRPASPLRAMGAWIAQVPFAGDRPGNLTHALLTLTPLMIAFTALKGLIPTLNPFAFDVTFAELDRAIFGTDPWLLLQPVLGYPPVTSAINFFYNLWFFIVFGVLFWQGFHPRRSALRLQYLLAHSFAWFLAGNVLAVFLASVGPCFYGLLLPGPDPYAEQMVYLRAAAESWPVWSLGVQEMLWNLHLEGGAWNNAISAMPSMHVTAATLMMLMGWRSGRVLGTLLTLFFAVVLVGSVHLAWHYAVDGIAGIVLAVAFWQVAGLIARRWMPESPAPQR